MTEKIHETWSNFQDIAQLLCGLPFQQWHLAEGGAGRAWGLNKGLPGTTSSMWVWRLAYLDYIIFQPWQSGMLCSIPGNKGHGFRGPLLRFLSLIFIPQYVKTEIFLEHWLKGLYPPCDSSFLLQVRIVQTGKFQWTELCNLKKWSEQLNRWRNWGPFLQFAEWLHISAGVEKLSKYLSSSLATAGSLKQGNRGCASFSSFLKIS